eukprot:scaffold524_cov357-Pavlova_lutheri.AAC.13
MADRAEGRNKRMIDAMTMIVTASPGSGVFCHQTTTLGSDLRCIFYIPSLETMKILEQQARTPCSRMKFDATRRGTLHMKACE